MVVYYKYNFYVTWLYTIMRALCVITVHTQMTSSHGVIHLSKLSSRFLPSLFKLFCCLKQIDFIFCASVP